jgi:hypothetical protein
MPWAFLVVCELGRAVASPESRIAPGLAQQQLDLYNPPEQKVEDVSPILSATLGLREGTGCIHLDSRGHCLLRYWRGRTRGAADLRSEPTQLFFRESASQAVTSRSNRHSVLPDSQISIGLNSVCHPHSPLPIPYSPLPIPYLGSERLATMSMRSYLVRISNCAFPSSTRTAGLSRVSR